MSLRLMIFAAVFLVMWVFAGCRGAGEAERPSPPVMAVEEAQVVESPQPKPAPVAEEPSPPAPPPETHAVFDLIDNRPLAHRWLRGGLYIDAGEPGFARYVHGNRDRQWLLNESVDGRAVAEPRRQEAPVVFPLSEEQARAARVIQVELWYGSGRYPLEVEVGGETLGEHELAEGWQTVTFDVPEGTFEPGENAIVLDLPADSTRSGSRSRGALASVYVGPEALAAGEGAKTTATPTEGVGADRGLRLSAGERLAWYTVLPPSSWVYVRPTEAPASPCRVEVEVTTEDGVSRTYASELSGSGEDPGTLLELGQAPADEVVRMAVGLSSECPEVTLTGAELRSLGPAPQMPEFEPPRNVVFWLIDALRADRLRSIRPDTRVQTPNLDRFAAEGAVFTRAYVQGNESFASHAAIFAGRYPEASHVLSSRDHVSDDELLLAELARRAGLFTGGYSSNGHIRSSNGFEQGFQTYVNTLRDNYRYRAPDMYGHASRWVDEHGADPFYLYIGTVDSHVTYRAHDDILPLYDPEPYDGPFVHYCSGEELGRIKSGAMRITDRDRVRIEAIYDDTVTFNDRYFGLFIDHLDEMGILDETAVIVTSDHGDEFWEHDSVGHGHSVYDELVHVPVLIRYPAAIPAGTVVSRGVDTVDLLPSLADLLGVDVPETIQGESLLPLIHGVGAECPRPAFAQQYGHTHAMSLDRWKVIWRSGGERRLYDIREDPTEQVDVADAHPFALRFMTDAMGLFMAYRNEWSKSEWGVASNLSPGFDPT